MPQLQFTEDESSVMHNLKQGSHCQVQVVTNNESGEHLFELIFLDTDGYKLFSNNLILLNQDNAAN